MPPTTHLRTLPVRFLHQSTPHPLPPTALLQPCLHLHIRPRPPSPARTFLTASTSPTIEGAWLSKNGRNHRGGAALAAKMSPRAQLVAAEEGLNTWLNTTSKTRKAPETMAPPSEADAPVPWNSIPESAPAVPAVMRRPRSPYTSAHAAAAAAVANAGANAQRDDTPGLIAFSAFLLLPLAFQLGRYFEGREKREDTAAPVAVPADGLERLGQSGLGGMAQDLLWSGRWNPLPGIKSVGLEMREERMMEKGARGWFWAG